MMKITMTSPMIVVMVMMMAALIMVALIPTVESFKSRWQAPFQHSAGNVFDKGRINCPKQMKKLSPLYERIGGGYNRGGYRGGGRGYRGGGGRGRSSR